MAKMEPSIVLQLMAVMTCVVMCMTGLIAGIIQRSGFCVAGRGTAAAQSSIYVPGIATSTTRLTRTSISGSVVPGLSRSLFFVLYLCGNLFPQIF